MIHRSRRAESVLRPTTLTVLGFALVASAGFWTNALHAQNAGEKTVWDGVYTTEQSQRGRTISEAGCVSCHGNQLIGSDLAPPLQGTDFKAVWASKTAGDLFEKIRTTMPADGPGTLKPEQAADLVAYMFELNHFPSGTTELPSEPGPLGLVRIRSEK